MATMAADWSELPWDLLNELVNRFGLPHDFVKFKSVCSSWRSSVLFRPSNTPQFLGLMLPGEETDRRDFYSPLDDKVYKNLLRVPDDHYCRGNRDGWLITVSCSSAKNVCLLNPRSGDLQTDRFPSLTSLEKRPEDAISLQTPFQFFWFLWKAVLSANPSNKTPTGGLTMVIISGGYRRLSCAREGADAWVVVEEVERSTYQDIIYYKDGFYAVNQKGTFFYVDIHCSVPTVRVVIPSDPEDYFYILYLVESYDGELLLVSRDMNDGGDEMAPDYLRDGGQDYETSWFDVYQLDLKNGVKTQITDDLGDQSLFLGVNTSLSIHSPEKIGLRKNCIYFTDDYLLNDRLGGIDIGIFDFGTGKFERRYSREILEVAPQPMWFTL